MDAFGAYSHLVPKGSANPPGAPAAAASSGDFGAYASLVPAPPPPPEEPGYGALALEGARRSIQSNVDAARQTAAMARGEQPQVPEQPPSPTDKYFEPYELGMPTAETPKKVVAKTFEGLVGSVPEMLGGIAGAAAGAPLGPVGAVGGMALGSGATAAAKALAPFYAEELKANPNDADAAFDRAVKRAAVSGGATGVAFGSFVVQPFAGAVKNLLFQAFGMQPAVGAAGRAAENVAAGRPAGDHLASAALEAIPGTLAPALAHGVGRFAVGTARPQGPSAATLELESSLRPVQTAPGQAGEIASALAVDPTAAPADKIRRFVDASRPPGAESETAAPVEMRPEPVRPEQQAAAAEVAAPDIHTLMPMPAHEDATPAMQAPVVMPEWMTPRMRSTLVERGIPAREIAEMTPQAVLDTLQRRESVVAQDGPAAVAAEGVTKPMPETHVDDQTPVPMTGTPQVPAEGAGGHAKIANIAKNTPEAVEPGRGLWNSPPPITLPTDIGGFRDRLAQPRPALPEPVEVPRVPPPMLAAQSPPAEPIAPAPALSGRNGGNGGNATGANPPAAQTPFEAHVEPIRSALRDRLVKPVPAAIQQRFGIPLDDARRALDFIAGRGGVIRQKPTGGYALLPQRTGPVDLVTFLAGHGGIRNERGEFRDHQKFVPGAGPLVRKTGMPLDRAREIAEEAGYPVDGIAGLIDAIRNNVMGRPVYSERDASSVFEREHARGMEEQRARLEYDAHDLGIDAPEKMSDDALHAAIVEKRLAHPADDRFAGNPDDPFYNLGDEDLNGPLPAERHIDDFDIPFGPDERVPVAQARPAEASGLDEGFPGDRGRQSLAAADDLSGQARDQSARAVASGRGLDLTDQGVQRVIPGAERASDATMAQRRTDAPLRPTRGQKAPGEDGGLFDSGAGKQNELFSIREEDIDRPLIARAKERFGVTRDPKEAFYILPDGTFLDGSDRANVDSYHRQGDRFVVRPGERDDMKGSRSADHRDVSELFDHVSGTDAMSEFMRRTGAVRVDFNAGIADASHIPTAAQIRALHNGAREAGTRGMQIERNAPDGRSMGSAYLERINPANLKKFFEDPVSNNGRTLFSRRADEEGPPPDPSIDWPRVETALRGALDHWGLGGVAARLVAEIRTPDGALANAAYKNRLIRMAMDRPENIGWAGFHEALHALKDIGVIKPAEWKVLERQADRWREKYNIDRRYGFGKGDEALAREEAISHAAEDYYKGLFKPGGPIKTAFKRAFSTMEAIGNAFRGMGFRSADDVFRAIEQGRMQGRDEGRAPSGAEMASIRAYHGSPHDFDRFDASKIGTGEGAQVYGHGLYFAGRKEVAKHYRDKLAFHPKVTIATEVPKAVADIIQKASRDPYNRIFYARDLLLNLPSGKLGERAADAIREGLVSVEPNLGRLYTADLAPDEHQLLDWDKPVSQQSPYVRERLRHLGLDDDATDGGQGIYEQMVQNTARERDGLSRMLANKRAEGDTRSFPDYEAKLAAMQDPRAYASTMLREAGIPGIRYLDAGSRRKGEGAHNYVIFDDKDVSVAEKLSRRRAAPEDERDLVAVHNLTEANLHHADRMGGLAVPSVAISHKTHPFGNFGEISLIAPKGVVDPRSGARVFGADAYSPRYPDVRYKVNDEALKKAWDRLSDASKDLGYRLSSELDESDLARDGMRAFDKSKVAKLQFLRETGRKVDETNLADLYESRLAIDTAMKGHDHEYQDWVQKNFGDVLKGERLRSESRDGSPRYERHTLGNVVKIMKRRLGEGEGFNYGVGSIRSRVTPQFRSIAEIKAEKGRLVDGATFEKVRKEIDGEFATLETRLLDRLPKELRFSDTVDKALEDVARTGRVEPALREWFPNATPEDVKAVGDFMQKLRGLPTGYFEAKLPRAVRLGEFAGAVVPHDASARTIETLKRHGIEKIERYQRHDQESRHAAVQRFQDEMFSRRNDDLPIDRLARPMRALMRSAPMRSIVNSTAGQKLGAAAEKIRDNLLMNTAPMALGSDQARATAKDFANELRYVNWRFGQIDRMLEKLYKPERRAEMGSAMDEQSVMDQLGEVDPKRGLGRLSADERATAEMLDRMSQRGWKRLQAAGIVQGEGLPHYMPRAFVYITDGGAIEHLPGEGGGPTALDPVGQNLRTRAAEFRDLLTPEESLAAKQKMYGPNVRLVTDIRALPMALARAEKAIAGRKLVDAVRELGTRTGTETVIDHDAPGYFTIDHPAMQTFRPAMNHNERGEPTTPKLDAAGMPVMQRVPMFISREFEGPLRAVLSKRPGAVYQALMNLKSAATSLIMFSPMIHNTVEFGRAFPMMPGKVLTLGVYRDGKRVMQDPKFMHRMISAGYAPIGKGWLTDITGIEAENKLGPGKGPWSRGLGAVADIASPKAGDAVRRGLDKAGEVWHEKLLWEQIAKLQAGIAYNMEKKLLAEGFSPKAAATGAAHMANRYAGALPMESMSDMARRVANLAMFSRSFTLGNLGVMKDMANGLPRDLRSQLLRDVGEIETKRIQVRIARKSVGAFMIDLGLFYGMNAAIQSGVQAMSDDTGETVADGYVRRLKQLASHVAEHPLDGLNPFHTIRALTPNSENEPGKEDRIYIGKDKNGRALYARNAFGKIGEEFEGYLTKPLEMLKRKLSTLARPALQIIDNDAGFGKPIYRADDTSTLGMAKAVGNVVGFFLSQQLPLSALRGGYDYASGAPQGELAATKAVLPLLTGVTLSSGYPGGPAEGARAGAIRRYEADRKEIMPQARRLIEAGKTDQAVELMQTIKMPPGEMQGVIKSTLAPGRAKPQAERRFQRVATPDEQQQRQFVTGAPQAGIAGAMQRGAESANEMWRSTGRP